MMRNLGAAVLIAAALAAIPACAEETVLVFAAASPPTAEISREFMRPWAERVNADGKGVLRIDYREGMALATTVNSYDRVMSDTVQISFMLPAYVAGKFPRSQVITLPYVAPANSGEASVALWRLYQKGVLAREYDQVHVLMISQVGHATVHLAKPPPAPTELAGKKLLVTSKTLSDTVTRLGAAPLSLPIDQLYESISRHLIDGAVVGWPTFQPFKMIEITNYHIDTALGSSAAAIFMAKARYDALPPEAKKILDAHSGEAASRAYGEFWDLVANRARDQIKATPNQQLVPLNEDDAATWREKTKPVIADWIKNTPDGQETLDQFAAMLAAVHAGK